MTKTSTAKRTVKDTRGKGGKKKVCSFCKDRVDWVDYKDIATLRRFMSERGKIRSRRVTGNCAQHQRDIQVAIKNARELALLPYVQRTTTERGLGRSRSSAGQEAEADEGAGEALAAYQADADDVEDEEAPTAEVGA
jgi:small subunit ribosomal protein S18